MAGHDVPILLLFLEPVVKGKVRHMSHGIFMMGTSISSCPIGLGIAIASIDRPLDTFN